MRNESATTASEQCFCWRFSGWNLYLEGLSKVKTWSGQIGESTIRRLTWDPPAPVLMRSCKSNRPLSMLKTLQCSHLWQASKHFVKHHWNSWDSGGIPAPALLHEPHGFPPHRVSFLQIIQLLLTKKTQPKWPRNGLCLTWASGCLRNSGHALTNWTQKYEETQNDKEWQLWQLQNQRS